MKEPLSPLQRWSCGHSELTPEDGKGYSICVRCGAALITRMTREIFDASVAAMFKRKP